MAANEGSKMITGKELLAGGLVMAGSLLGVTLGILYAPGSGKETGEVIRHSAEALVVARFLDSAR